jgi:hypothetical protein
MSRSNTIWSLSALVTVLMAGLVLSGCAWNDGLDEAGPIIANPSTPHLSTQPLGPLAGAYDVAPPPGLTPEQTYDRFHQAVTDRNTQDIVMFLSSQTRDRLAQLGLCMSVTDVPTLINDLLQDPQFAAFAPDESIKDLKINGDTAVVTTRKGNTVNLSCEDGCWRIVF